MELQLQDDLRPRYRMYQRNGQMICEATDLTPLQLLQVDMEVFVGNIPRKFQVDQVLQLFGKVPGLKELRLMVDFSGTNRGFGFAKYAGTANAKAAVRWFDGFKISESQTLAVVKSVNNRFLQISQIPAHLLKENIEKDLRTRTAGVVRVIMERKNEETTCCLVEYREHRMAAEARRILIPPGPKVCGCTVEVDWARPSKVIPPANTHKEPHASGRKQASALLGKYPSRKTSAKKPGPTISHPVTAGNSLFLDVEGFLSTITLHSHIEQMVVKKQNKAAISILHLMSSLDYTVRNTAARFLTALDKNKVGLGTGFASSAAADYFQPDEGSKFCYAKHKSHLPSDYGNRNGLLLSEFSKQGHKNMHAHLSSGTSKLDHGNQNALLLSEFSKQDHKNKHAHLPSGVRKLGYANANVPLPSEIGKLCFSNPNAPSMSDINKLGYANANVPLPSEISKLSYSSPSAHSMSGVGKLGYVNSNAPLSPRVSKLGYANLNAPGSPGVSKIGYANLNAPGSPGVSKIGYANLNAPGSPGVSMLDYENMNSSLSRVSKLNYESVNAPSLSGVCKSGYSNPNAALSPGVCKLGYADTNVPLPHGNLEDLEIYDPRLVKLALAISSVDLCQVSSLGATFT